MKTSRFLSIIASCLLVETGAGVQLAHAADALKFYESTHAASGYLFATATMSLAPGDSFDAKTPFDLSLGGFQFHAVLGDDHGYTARKTKATFITRGPHSAPLTRATLQWRRGKLTVTVVAQALDTADLADDFVSNAASLQSQVSLGKSSEQYTVNFRRVIGRFGKISRGKGGSAAALPAGSLAAAKFHVDLPTSQVSVVAPSPAPSGPSPLIAFQGSTILFNNSTLLDQPGDTGVKVVNVSLTNRFALPVGSTPDGTVTGLRVLFGSFNNVGTFSDPRPRTIVSTTAGTGAAGSQNGAAASASFNGPRGVAVDSTGAIYITDYANNKVRKIKGGLVSTLAGSGTAGGVDGGGTAAGFNGPWGVAVNPVDGALIVTDFTGNRVRRITLDGIVTTVAGTGTAGSASGAGNVATFNQPTGVAVDGAGIIYVAEYAGNRIRKIVLTPGADPRVAANYTASTLAGSGLPAAGDGVGGAANFNQPMGLTIIDGAIYVADSSNNEIRRVSATGEVVTIAGTGVASEINGSGEAATFNIPRGITALGGSLVVCDHNGNTVRQMTLKESTASPGSASSWLVTTIAGTGGAGAADGRGNVATFNAPNFIATDGSRNVFVADSNSNKVRKITPALGFFPLGIPTGAAPAEKVQLSNADGVIPNSGAGANLPYINYPGSLDVGATSAAQDWNFIVPSGVTAFEFTATVEANTTALETPFTVSNPGSSGAGSPNDDVRTFAGSATGITGFVDGIGSQARFGGLYGMACDSAGNIFVVDYYNESIRRVSNQGVATTVAGLLGTGVGALDGLGTVASFDNPGGIAVTPDGRTLFVTEFSNNTIRRIALLPVAGSNPPVYDPTNPANWSVSTIAGSGGASDSYADGLGINARFAAISGIVLDASGNLFVTEQNGNRVRRVQYRGGDAASPESWYVSLVAGDNSTTDGAAGTTDGFGYAARFSGPQGIAADLAGNLYVADEFNSQIRKITNPADGSGCTVTTLAGSSFGYADGAGAAAKFNDPYGMAIDSAGYLWVTEISNRRVRRISPTGVVETVAGTGAAAATDGPGNLAAFLEPFGICVDSAGNLFVSDGLARICLIQRVLTDGAP